MLHSSQATFPKGRCQFSPHLFQSVVPVAHENTLQNVNVETNKAAASALLYPDLRDFWQFECIRCAFLKRHSLKRQTQAEERARELSPRVMLVVNSEPSCAHFSFFAVIRCTVLSLAALPTAPPPFIKGWHESDRNVSWRSSVEAFPSSV